ncbi:MAG: acetyl-CoA decarbonylase/synthase complex subunit alpha/beta [Actinomycetota bacterium]|nr:acetyl-CoA decarbonylase/synthase complex subunit alpha/beta [Actinomycetota bacterium]
MSKIIASAAIRGAHKIVVRAEKELKKALEKHGPDKKVEFPNTGYYLPVIYGMTGISVSKLGDMQPVLEKAKSLLPPVPSEKVWLPYLGPALDAGMATLFADEVIEAIKYIDAPPYTITPAPEADNIWLGAADDVIMRERGIEFVDGTAPGFAACVGAAPTNEIAVKLARELQEKNLYVFMSASTDGRSMAEQLAEEGIQMGWETRLVPFGKDITATVFSLGFATRAALSFGGVSPGDFRRVLLYNKNRIFAFVLALGEVDDEKYAQAAGAINFGFPAVADTDIPEILPTGVCTYEHVVANVPHDKLVSRAIEVRGLKVTVTKIPIPVAYGPAFEGERVRKEDCYLEMGGGKTHAFELLRMRDIAEVEDGKIELVGTEITDVEFGAQLPYGMVVEVAGRKMQEDFEPILERQLHTFINGAEGVLHMGSRDVVWLRISKGAKEKGFNLSHLGEIVRAKLLADYPAIVDKVQVTIYTEQDKVDGLREEVRKVYAHRDERVAGMTDESVDIFYSCSLCQSFAPNHVCIISPERLGLCGAYNWLDGKASHEINPTGPNQPVQKGEVIDSVKGQWKGINNFVYEKSHHTLERFNAYALMEDPMTSCFVGDTEVVIDDKPIEIGEFIEKHRGSEEYAKSTALTLGEGKVTKDTIVAMQRFPAPERLIQIKTKSGTEVVLTPNHEIAAGKPSGMMWLRADKIEAGDRVLALKKLDLKGEIPEIIDLLPDDFWIERDGVVREVENRLIAKYGSKALVWRNLDLQPLDPRRKSIPLGTFKLMLSNLGEDWNRVKKLITKVIRGASVVSIPQARHGLFYLMGLIAADGSITKKGKYEYWIDFVNTNKDLVRTFEETYLKVCPNRHVGVRTRKNSQAVIAGRKLKSSQCFHCYTCNPLLGLLCAHYGIKIGSKGRWNLGRMVNLPSELISAFLAGLFDGDGSVRLRKYAGKWDIGEAYICIEDEKAAHHLQLLLKRLGIVGNVKKSASVYKVELHGSNLIEFCNLIKSNHPWKRKVLERIKKLSTKERINKTQEQVLPFAVGKARAELPESRSVLSSSTLSYYRNSKSRPVISDFQKVLNAASDTETIRSMIDIDYFLDIVTGVEEIENSGAYDYVYNLTLADNHTYVVNGGPLVKNCGCFECILAILPMCNGVMVVNREFPGMTPCGMKFSTLAGSVGGGAQTPGFLGVGKQYLVSKKFIQAEGGFKRIAWMPRELKELMREQLQKRAEEIGEPDFVDKIVDETTATTEEEVLEYMQKVNHPALTMEPLL